MIGPKVGRPTEADERRAYAIATERDEHLCQRCLRGGPTERDHRQNRQGGNTVASNLQLLCRACHLWKTEHPRDATQDGWSVPRSANSAEWPAQRWLRTTVGTLRKAWVLYRDDGTWTEVSLDEARRRMEGVVL